MPRSRFLSSLFFCLVVIPAAFASGETKAFTVGIEMPSQVPVTRAVESSLRRMGVEYINYYVKPWDGFPEERSASVNEAMMDFADEMALPFSLACYVVDPPEACVLEARKRGARFRGIVFDELAHCRQLNPHNGIPTFASGSSLKSLEEAYERTLEGYKSLREKYASLDVECVATHVFPVLHHVAARAGFTVCPKTQKEFYSTVSLAIGMGAALQYDRDLWVDCDLWHYAMVPGHPAEELWCNMLLAYWLGADLLYLEGCGHNLTEPGNQGIPFSLMTQVTDERYQLTAHGECLRRFSTEYVPRHPRPWTFRDVTPDIAVIRFPDSDYGQRFQYAGDSAEDSGTSMWHAGLYGSANLPPNEDTEAWFDLWNLLTFGTTGRDGISYFKCTHAAFGCDGESEPNQVESLHTRPLLADAHSFFVPMNNVVVFDHRVTYERIESVPLLFLTGVAVSQETLAAVKRRAKEGATVVIWGNLARKLGFQEYDGGVQEVEAGKGRYILTDVFTANELFQKIWMHMGRPDQIRYRFGENTVLLRRIAENRVEVTVDRP